MEGVSGEYLFYLQDITIYFLIYLWLLLVVSLSLISQLFVLPVLNILPVSEISSKRKRLNASLAEGHE